MHEMPAPLFDQATVLQVQIEYLQALLDAMTTQLASVDIGVRVRLAIIAAAAVRDVIDADDRNNRRGLHLRFIANMLNVPLYHVIGTMEAGDRVRGKHGAAIAAL